MLIYVLRVTLQYIVLPFFEALITIILAVVDSVLAGGCKPIKKGRESG